MNLVTDFPDPTDFHLSAASALEIIVYLHLPVNQSVFELPDIHAWNSGLSQIHIDVPGMHSLRICLYDFW